MSAERPVARAGRHEAITHAMEDYLKTIYVLEEEHGRVSTQAIAEHLRVQSPSVTNMLKRLASLKLVYHRPYRGVTLTPAGRRVALEVIRHHRLLELYLSEALGYSWDAVHEEADRLEHSISEELESRIDALLGYPSADPHGHPIPTPDGDLPLDEATRLDHIGVGSRVTIERVSDRDPEQLRYLATLGLLPGVEVVVLDRLPFAGPVQVRVGDREHYLSLELAQALFVVSTHAGSGEC
jgi:DtxR family Mn-dependent transcriptional regulator